MSEPEQKDGSIAMRGLTWLARMVWLHPKWFLWPQFLLLGLCIWYTVHKLEFSTSRDDLVGSDKKSHHQYLEYKKEFQGQDDLVVIVESEDQEKNRQFVERLGAKLELEAKLFPFVLYKGDLKLLGPKALLFLEEENLRDLQKTLGEYRPFISQFANATNLNSLFQLVNRQFRAAKQEENAENASLVKALPALQRVVDLAHDAVKRSGLPPSPGVTAFFDAGTEAQEHQYITFGKGSIYLLNARTGKSDDNEEAVKRLRELVALTQLEVPGVNVALTGEPVLEADEMQQSTHDSIIATILSLVICALLFIYSYRQTGRPLKATLCLIVGLGYTMGYTTLVVGHLNILTVTFLPILIGLAIDFGVHLITRYEEELRRGRSVPVALQKAMVNTGLGIFTGALTTAGAFFAMALTDFKGIQEMGIITGGGMLICLVPMMTLLPVLLSRGTQNTMDRRGHGRKPTREIIEQFWLQRPRMALVFTAILCLLAVTQFHKIYFDYNLLNMQSKGLPAVVFEHKLIDSSSKSVLFAASVATNAAHARELERRFTNLTTVASVDSMAGFLGRQSDEKLALIGKIKEDLATLQFPSPDPRPADVKALSLTLWSLRGYLGLAVEAVQAEPKRDEVLLGHLIALRKSIDEFRHTMLNGDAKAVGDKLGAYQTALLQDVGNTFKALRTQDNSGAGRVEDLPSQLRSRFVGKTGKLLLQVNPKQDVWDHDNQQRFVQELRTVDPDITGTPIQLLEYTTLLKDSYIQAAWYALGAIIVLVFMHFRNVPCVILALLPVAIGTTWMLGMMGVTGTPFNPANIMTLPLVIGIGVTNGIHILNRFAEEQNPSILALSTGKAVLVSALTTIAGFGSLIPAKHQGIASLGIVMSVGVAACMLAALTFLPALLTLLIKWGWSIKRPSGENAQSTLGREEPR